MFLHHWVEMGGFELNHHWHGINVLSILECCLLVAVFFSVLTLLGALVRESKRFIVLSIAGALSFSTAAYAANTALSNLTASGALAGANLIYVVQTAGSGGVKATMTQVATFINSLFSGDFTCASGGACTVTKTNGTAFTALATTAPGTGVATLLAGSSSGTGGPAGTVSPAFTGTPTAPTATVGTNTTQLATTAFVLANAPSGSGTVTSVSAGCGTSTGGAPITISGTVSASITSRTVATTTDAVVSTDCGNIVYANDASAIAGTIAQAGTTGFATGSFFEICNINAGAYTLTPTTSTIGGKTTLVIPAGTASNPSCTPFKSDGTNYNLMDIVYGSGVAAAIGNALSAAGGLTSTIFHGTAIMGTSAIASGACATVVTVTATGVATTDIVSASFNGDPTSVTGFIAPNVLTEFVYPSANAINIKECNSTASSITPGAHTFNVGAVR